MWRSSYRLLVELLVFLLALLFFGLVGIAWRLASGPLTLDWLVPHVAEALSDPAAGIRADLPRADLYWNQSAGELQVTVPELRLVGPRGEDLAHLELIRIKVDLLSLLLLHRPPFAVTVFDATVRLRQTETGQLVLAEAPALAPQKADAEPLVLLADLFARRPTRMGVGALGELTLLRARLVIADALTGRSWLLSLPSLSLARGEDGQLAGRARLEVEEDTGPNHIDFDYSYAPALDRLRVLARVVDLNPARLAGDDALLTSLRAVDTRLTGMAELTLRRDFTIQGVQADLRAEAGQVTLPALWDAPLQFRQARLRGHLDMARRRGSLDELSFDLGETNLRLTAELQPAGRDGLLRLGLQAPRLSIAQLLQVWPTGAAAGARRWVAASMPVGAIEKADLGFRLRLPSGLLADAELQGLDGGFLVRGATVRTLGDLPPLTGVNADARLLEDRLEFRVRRGAAGAVQLADGGTIAIDGLSGWVQWLKLDLPVRGTVPAVLALINHAPLGYADALGVAPAAVSGAADLLLRLRLPLLARVTMLQVALGVTGQLRDLASAELLPDIPLREGNFEIAVDVTGARLAGQVNAKGMPIAGVWQEFFRGPEARRVNLTARFRPEQLGEDWPLPPDLLSGTIDARLDLVQISGGAATLRADLDLQAAAIDFHPLAWRKGPGDPAGLSLAARSADGTGWQIERLKAAGPGLVLNARGQLVPGKSAQLELAKATLGDSDFSGRWDWSAVAGLSLALKGTMLDLSGLAQDEAADTPPEPPVPPRPLRLDISLGEIRTGPERGLRDVQLSAHRTAEAWQEAAISLKTLAGVPFALRLSPPGADRQLQASTPDLGAVLAAAGLLESLRGGTLDISGTAPTTAAPVVGRVILSDFQVRDAPFLARLLTLASPTGFLEFVSGAPLAFGSLKGDYRLDGFVLTLQDWRASGASLGMTVRGTMDWTARQLALEGAVIPAYLFGQIISSIPLIGTIFGGTQGEGVFAARYTVRGDLLAPELSVNPLSALTPGILRDVIFGSSSETITPARPAGPAAPPR